MSRHKPRAESDSEWDNLEFHAGFGTVWRREDDKKEGLFSTNNRPSTTSEKNPHSTLPLSPSKPPSGNEFESEAVPGALPRGQNNPKVRRRAEKEREKEGEWFFFHHQRERKERKGSAPLTQPL
jgi:hypothetical protein